MYQIWGKKSVPGTDAHLLHSCRKLQLCRVKKCWKTEAIWHGRKHMGISIKKLGFKSWFYQVN